jgi:hypothetical protein
MMGFRTEALNASGEQTELHSEFDQQAEIMKPKYLTSSHELRQIFLSSDSFRHKDPTDAGVCEPLRPSQNLFPESVVICSLKIVEFGLRDELLNQLPHFSVFAIENPLHGGWFEAERLLLERRITRTSGRRPDHVVAGHGSDRWAFHDLLHIAVG